MTIYVGNLSYDATEDDLAQVFAEYGTVKSATMPTDRETGRVRGFGFVEMETDEEEENAHREADPCGIAQLDGAQWMGREVRVNKARPKEPRGNRFKSPYVYHPVN